jgi:hypothetical protein
VNDGAASIGELRREIAAERTRLAEAVVALRRQVDAKRRQPLPVGLPLIAGAAVAGFVLAGGVRATIRLLAVRYRREHDESGLLGSLLRR